MVAVFRRVIAGIILGPALLLGSFAWWGFLSLRTVFDETRTETIAEELLDNEAVVDQISINIGKALQAAMPETIVLDEAQVEAGAAIILSDPVVRELITGSLGTTHRAFLGLDDAPSTIDLGPALVSIRARIGAVAPTVAEQIPESLEVELPTERIPNASPVKRFLERVVPLLAGIAVVLALLAFLTTSDRSSVLGKAARWAIATTAFYLIVGLGLPYLIRQFAPDGAEVLAALLTAVLRAALVPSIVLAVVGIVLLLLSMFWPSPEQRKGRRGREPQPVAAPAPVARSRPVAPVAAPSDATAAMPLAQPTPARPTPTPVQAAPVKPAPAPTQARPMPPSQPPPAVPSPPLLPTRAKPPTVDKPAWTGEPATESSASAGSATDQPLNAPQEQPKWLVPTWVEGHGWVMQADDPRDPPNNAHFVDGVGWVVPGPPPA